MEPPVNYFVRAAFLKVNRLQKTHRYEEDTSTKEDRDQMRNQKKKRSEIEIIKGRTENVTNSIVNAHRETKTCRIRDTRTGYYCF